MQNTKSKNSPSRLEGVGCETARGSMNYTESPKRVPKLRFKEFSGEWVEKKLGDISTNISYGIGSSAIEYDGFNKYLRITDIDETTRKFIPNPLTSPSGEIENKYFLEKGDIVFARTGASTGKSYIYNESDGNLVYAGFLIKFHINKAVPYFVYLNTLSDAYYKWVGVMSVRSGQPGINAEEYKKFKLNLPTFPEQQKIADCLSTWDEAIENLKLLIENKKLYKKGMMQKIFSQELRFKADDGSDFPEWQEKRLGEVAKISTGNSNREDSSLDGEYTFFDRSEDIRTSSIYLFDGEAVIVAGEGQRFIPKYFIGKFDLHQRTYAIMDFKDACGKFIFYKIYTKQNYFLAQAVGSTVKSLRLPMFIKMLLKLPCLQEQTKIANFLSVMDDEIELLEQELEQLQLQKKGLMQGMFV